MCNCLSCLPFYFLHLGFPGDSKTNSSFSSSSPIYSTRRQAWKPSWWSTSTLAKNHHALWLSNISVVYVFCMSSCENLVTVWQELYGMFFSHSYLLGMHCIEYCVQDVLQWTAYPYIDRRWVIFNMKLLVC